MKRNKGITLIALTVTIIVLLIISGVTISQVVENGIFKRTTTAKNYSDKTEEKEILNTSIITSIGKSNRAKLEEAYLRNNLEKNIGQEGKDYTLKSVQEEGGKKHFDIKFLKTENEYTILEDGTILEKENYDGQITIDSEDILIIEVGESKTITVETDSNDVVTWKSTNESAAQVKVENIRNTHVATVYGKANCDEVTIIASLTNGKKIEKKVKIQTSPKSVTILDKERLTINLGSDTDWLQLHAKVDPDTVNVNGNLTWKSSDSKIASVDNTGKVTGKTNGTVTITVSTENGKEDTCSVLVQTSPKSIKLSPSIITLDKSGVNTQEITVSFEPSTSNIENAIKWNISDSSKINFEEIVKDGKTTGTAKITGKANGTVTITATTANNKTATATVTVQTTIKSISLNYNNLTLDMSGTKTAKLEAYLNPSDSNVQNGITWTSSRSNVATVDSSGNVTGISNGTTVITAKTQSGKTATCNVTVQTSLKSISLNKSSIVLDMSGTKTAKLTVYYNPSGANINTGITWSSSNWGVVSVDRYGNITGVGNGGATITATAQNGSVASCSIVVIRSIISLSVSPTSKTLYMNQGLQLTKSINPSNTTEGTQWTSSNTGVAVVDGNGFVSPRGIGTTTITFKNSSGSKSATCQVTVKDYESFSISRNFTTTGAVSGGWHTCEGEINFGETRNVVSITGNGMVGYSGMWDEVNFGLRITGYDGSSWTTLWEDYQNIYVWWGQRGELYRNISITPNKRLTRIACDFYYSKDIGGNWWASDPRNSSFNITVKYSK